MEDQDVLLLAFTILREVLKQGSDKEVQLRSGVVRIGGAVVRRSRNNEFGSYIGERIRILGHALNFEIAEPLNFSRRLFEYLQSDHKWIGRQLFRQSIVEIDDESTDAISNHWQLALMRRLAETGYHAGRKIMCTKPESVPILEPGLIGSVFKRWRNTIFSFPRIASLEPPRADMCALPFEVGWVDRSLVRVFNVEQSLPMGGMFRKHSDSVFDIRFLGEPIEYILETLQGTTVIVGEPGSGKTTLLASIARQLLTNKESRFLLPAIIPLRQYSLLRDEEPLSLVEFFLRSCGFRRQKERAELAEWLRYFAEESPSTVLLLLDGWDEVPESEQESLRNEIERESKVFCTIITSRPSGAPLSLPVDRDRFFEIAPLAADRIKALSVNWFKVLRKPTGSLVLNDHLRKHPDLRNIASNPFLLTLLCAAVSDHIESADTVLPSTRSQLYRMALDGVISHHNRRYPALRIEPPDRRHLERFAFALFDSGDLKPRYWFEKEELDRMALKKHSLARRVLYSRMVTPTQLDDETLQFCHATFQEFFAAAELLRRHQHLLDEPLWLLSHPTWQEVLRFAAGQVSGEVATRLWKAIACLTQEPDRVGLIYVRVAQMVAEMGCIDGGLSTLGIDIRSCLWQGIQDGIATPVFARAYAALAPRHLLFQILNSFPHADGEAQARMVRCLDYLPPEMASAAVSSIVLDGEETMSAIASYAHTAIDRGEFEGFCRIATSPSADPGQRMRAITTLAHTEDPVAVPFLVQVVETERDASTRVSDDRALAMQAIAGLGMIGGDIAATAVCRLLDDPLDEIETEDLLSALGQTRTAIGRNRLLVELATQSPASSTIRTTLESLGDTPLIRGGSLVQSYAESSYPEEVRIAAVRALRDTTSNEVQEFMLARAMNDPSQEVREAALNVLSTNCGIPQARRLLVIAEDLKKSPPERRYALHGVLELVHRQRHTSAVGGLAIDAVRVVTNSLSRSRGEVAEMTAGMAWVLGEQMIPLLEQVAENTKCSYSIRMAACRSLGQMRSSGSIQLLSRIARSGRKQQSAAIQGLSQTAADSLAQIEPEVLLRMRVPAANRALAKYSIHTGNLVFANRIVRYQQNASKPVAVPKGRTVESDQPKLDAAIVIALTEEYAAVRHLFPPQTSQDTSPKSGRLFRFFNLTDNVPGNRSFRVVVSVVGDMGHEQMGFLTRELLDRYAPSLIALVGISAGRHGEVKLGDVVVANQVTAYLQAVKLTTELGTGNHVLRHAGRDYDCSGQIVRCGQQLTQAKEFGVWQRSRRRSLAQLVAEVHRKALILKDDLGDRPFAYFGPIASGPVVVEDQDAFNWLLARNRKYLAIDMESAGFVAAVRDTAKHPECAVFRGISDFGRGDKKKLDKVGNGVIRRYAMQNATQLILQTIYSRLASLTGAEDIAH